MPIRHVEFDYDLGEIKSYDPVEEGRLLAADVTTVLFATICPHCASVHLSHSVPGHMFVYRCQNPKCAQLFEAGLYEIS